MLILVIYVNDTHDNGGDDGCRFVSCFK